MGVKQITKISLAWELHQEGVPQSHIAQQLNLGRTTIWRWLAGIRDCQELEYFIDKYLAAKKGPRKKRKVDPILKRRIWDLRERHHDCCGQKIQYHLKKKYGIQLGVTTIYKVLDERFELRSKWKKNQKPGPVPEATGARQVVQMDTVHFGWVFAFNAIDIFTREVDVLLRPSLEAADGQTFLHVCMRRRFDGFSDLIQTDGGSEFKGEFHDDAPQYCHRHRYARSYKKNEQSYIESFNRSLRKECLGWLKYRPDQIPDLTKQLNDWLVYYHHERPHIGLGMRPPLEKEKVFHI